MLKTFFFIIFKTFYGFQFDPTEFKTFQGPAGTLYLGDKNAVP